MPSDVRLIRSPMSVAGMVLTTVSGALFIVVFVADVLGIHTNPYLGIVFFLVLPTLFVVGLLLIPFGAWRERRRRAAGKAPSSAEWPRIDLNDPRQRTTVVIVFCLTLANIVLVSLGAYSGIEYMDTVGFCGEVCHVPMKPQLRAHQAGPHTGTTCVACHVGPRPSQFVESKLEGTRRVVGVATGNYARPITATADELVSARDTCERCHSSDKFQGDTTRRIVEFADDEMNTQSVTTLRMHLGGGGDLRGNVVPGIHWHANPANQVEYIATGSDRQTIPYVRVTDGTGAVREYVVDGTAPELVASGERRRMECTDCHNRAGHPIAATPQRAVNEAMARNRTPTTLPFAHREAVKALTATYPSEEVATAEIARALKDFYQTQQPVASTLAAEVDRVILGVQEIYRRNVFPDTNVTFGTYPNNIGHIDFPGCFRCHDDEHKSQDGKTIGQDCETCHAIE